MAQRLEDEVGLDIEPDHEQLGLTRDAVGARSRGEAERFVVALFFRQASERGFSFVAGPIGEGDRRDEEGAAVAFADCDGRRLGLGTGFDERAPEPAAAGGGLE